MKPAAMGRYDLSLLTRQRMLRLIYLNHGNALASVDQYIAEYGYPAPAAKSFTRNLLRFEETGSVLNKPKGGGGRKKTVQTPENQQLVDEHVRNNPDTASIKKTAKALNINRSSVQKMLVEAKVKPAKVKVEPKSRPKIKFICKLPLKLIKKEPISPSQ